MKRRHVDWTWEHPEAQAAFVEWVGFPGREITVREVDEIERLLGLRRTESVLDLGCGNGRHAVEMATRGYDVVGIDVAESYLAQARELSQRAGVSVEFRLQRGSQITEAARFDVILAIDHTLGFMDLRELALQFERVARALRPRGCLLLRTAGPRLTHSTDVRPIRSWEEKSGRFILTDRRMRDRTRVEHCIVIDFANDEIVEYHEEQRAFAHTEVVDLLRSAGFVTIACFKDLSGNDASDEEFGVYVGRR